MEARAGIEPAYTDLQSVASPLCHRALLWNMVVNQFVFIACFAPMGQEMFFKAPGVKTSLNFWPDRGIVHI